MDVCSKTTDRRSIRARRRSGPSGTGTWTGSAARSPVSSLTSEDSRFLSASMTSPALTGRTRSVSCACVSWAPVEPRVRRRPSSASSASSASRPGVVGVVGVRGSALRSVAAAGEAMDGGVRADLVSGTGIASGLRGGDRVVEVVQRGGDRLLRRLDLEARHGVLDGIAPDMPPAACASGTRGEGVGIHDGHSRARARAPRLGWSCGSRVAAALRGELDRRGRPGDRPRLRPGPHRG